MTIDVKYMFEMVSIGTSHNRYAVPELYFVVPIRHVS